jgi:c-di-GMP-binding flagellar brake protein YcgR
MAKSMSKVRRDGETRQHQRFMVPKGIFVIVSPGTDKEWKVQAIDISHGGLAFVYQGAKEDLDTSGALKILAKNVDIENLNFETVSDEPAPGSNDTSLPSRRRGVKFKWMGLVEKQDLRDFINSLSVSVPMS